MGLICDECLEKYGTRRVQRVLLHTQTFTVPIIQGISSPFKDFPHMTCECFPMLQWSGNWLERFHTMNSKALPAADCQEARLTAEKSLIRNPNAGMGIFTRGAK